MSSLINHHVAHSRRGGRSVTRPCWLLFAPTAALLFPFHSAALRRANKAQQKRDFGLIFHRSPLVSNKDGEEEGSMHAGSGERLWLCVGGQSWFSWKPRCSQDISHRLPASHRLGIFLYNPLASPQQDLQLLRRCFFFFFTCVSRWADSEQSIALSPQSRLITSWERRESDGWWKSGTQ